LRLLDPYVRSEHAALTAPEGNDLAFGAHVLAELLDDFNEVKECEVGGEILDVALLGVIWDVRAEGEGLAVVPVLDVEQVGVSLLRQLVDEACAAPEVFDVALVSCVQQDVRVLLGGEFVGVE
jgi:hypothetical protein